MSTINVALAERLAEAHRAKRQGFVSAPVFGRPEATAAAKLYVIAAGAPDAVERCLPVFEVLGQRIHRRPRAAQGEPRQAQRELPHHLGDRGARTRRLRW
ncbi:MAG: NAD(P)-binding domain-containing protein [Methyloceanibacter sp.]